MHSQKNIKLNYVTKFGALTVFAPSKFSIFPCKEFWR